MTNVASITLAFNERDSLPRQLEALQNQTVKLQEMVVVDNGSSDGTSAFLAENYPSISVLRLPENVGAAGAWAAGLAYASGKRRYDWIWTFDADSVPPLDALRRLLDAIASPESPPQPLGIVAPMPIHRATGIYYPPLLWREGFVGIPPEKLRDRLCSVDLVIASGSLLRGDVVSHIGLPRADFFMDFFDYEYSLRARAGGFTVAVVPDVELDHQIGSATEINFFGRRRLWTSYSPWREYYNARNLTYAGWHLFSTTRTKCFVLRHLVRHAGAVVLFSPSKAACLYRIGQGFLDGISQRLGTRFSPAVH